MEKKVCTICHGKKALSEFYKNRRCPDGLQTYCKVCNSVRVRRYYLLGKKEHLARVYRRRKRIQQEYAERIVAYLREHPCVDCGEKDPLVLDFDHVRGKKVASICQLVGREVAWEKIEAEIKKCEVRCRNCHMRRTHGVWQSRRWKLCNGIDSRVA